MPTGPVSRDATAIVGQTLSGCRIERALARGGMGSVYLARREDGREVVIKLLAPELASDPTYVERFRREGEALRRIRPNPHVVQVLDVAVDGARPHIVMEYVAGDSLARTLESRGKLSPQGAARVARDVALGLSAVHRAGLVHRDVKPANVVLTRFGDAKLVDFGVVKDVFSTGLTRPEELIGSSQYMAPEQWGDFEEDARCDLFALGATLYHALTGQPAFDGKNWMEISKRAKAGEYLPLRKAAPGSPRELELVVAQMLMPDLRFRYGTADEVAEDLSRVLRNEPVNVPSLVPAEAESEEERHALLPGRRFTIGRDAHNDVVLRHATVSRRHAELRREAEGYVIQDTGSTYGTWVGEEQVRERRLQDGDRVRLGDVELRFVDPRSRDQTAPFLLDVARIERPLPLVEALAEMDDKRAVVHLLEQLAEDPLAEGMAEVGLRGLLDEATLSAVRARRAELRSERRAELRARLERICNPGESLGDDPRAWLAWWDRVRTDYPVQVGVEGPRAVLRLRVREGEPAPVDFELGDHGMVLVGRDPKCHLRLQNRTVSRLHVRILRLHRRLVAVDGGSRFGSTLGGEPFGAASFFDPGMKLGLGDVTIELEVDEAAGPSRAGLGHWAIDADSFQALLELHHPSVTAALVVLLHEQRRNDWIATGARGLYPEDEAAAARCREHLERRFRQLADRARALLPELLPPPADADASTSTWAQLLVERRTALPPQLLPRGWVALTRTTSRMAPKDEAGAPDGARPS